MLACSDAGMRSLDKSERPLLPGERGEAGKSSTARTCAHEERLREGGSKGEAKGGVEKEEGSQCLELNME